jgi:hypothetical protein
VTDRLPAHIEAAGFRRLAEAEGGSATILAKGDTDRGSILLLIRERGTFSIAYERKLDANGRYAWQSTGPSADSGEAEISDFCDRRRRFDPDLWLIELDVPQVERFIVNASIKD